MSSNGSTRTPGPLPKAVQDAYALSGTRSGGRTPAVEPPARAARAGVLVPTCDRVAFFEQALRSAREQTWAETEILVLDNGETRGAEELAVAAGDPRVRYVRNPENLGLIGSIRKGMGLFSESVAWCTILPDDDLLDRGFIRSMLGHVEKHADLDVVEGRRVLIGPAGEPLSESPVPPGPASATDYLVSRSQFRRQAFLAGVFFSRKAYEAIGGYPPLATGMASDDALIFALALRRGLHCNAEATAFVRMHPDAESHSAANAVGNIRSFGDFRRYVSAKARACPSLTRAEVRTVERTAKRYTEASINEFWIRRCRDLLRARGPESRRALGELYALGLDLRYPFSARYRLSALFGRLLRVHLERSPGYGRFWDGLLRLRARARS